MLVTGAIIVLLLAVWGVLKYTNKAKKVRNVLFSAAMIFIALEVVIIATNVFVRSISATFMTVIFISSAIGIYYFISSKRKAIKEKKQQKKID